MRQKKQKFRPVILAIGLIFIFGIGILIGTYWCRNQSISKIPVIVDDMTEKLPTIFVSIASYRDKHCPKTLEELYLNAAYPERIFVGIYQQNGPYDIACESPRIPEHLRKNIKVIAVPETKATGPCTARYHSATLYNDQDFFMQIDSHMRFRQGWDELVLSMWQTLSEQVGEKVILSHYPPEWVVAENRYPDHFEDQVSVTCHLNFHSKGMPTAQSNITKRDGTYNETFTIAGGLLFGPGQMIRDVPYDPNLHFLFQGEELMHSVRFWCAGYRIYNPTANIAAHYYDRPTDPKIWDDAADYAVQNKKISAFIKRQLGMTEEAVDETYPYSVSQSCLDAFYAQYKIDPKGMHSKTLCERYGFKDPTPEDVAREMAL